MCVDWGTTLEAIVQMPATCASIRTIPNPSHNEGSTNTSMAFSKSFISILSYKIITSFSKLYSLICCVILLIDV